MSFKTSITILVMIFSCLLAQGQPIKIGQFGFSQSVWDASTRTLKVKRNGESKFIVFVSMQRTNLPEWTQGNKKFNIEVEAFAKRKNSDQLEKISGDIKFSTSDFIGTSSTTDIKNPWPELIIPAGYIGEDGGNIIVKWRFYKEKYPSPYHQDGWTEWFTLDHVFNLALEPLVLPPSTFTGPDQICSSGTYTITNPGTITLENAAGIANLTNMGNNQWKVERVGGASGKIKIVITTSSGQTSKKDIVVGTNSPNFKYDYSSQLDYGQTYTFIVESDFSTDLLEIEKLGNANIVFTRVDNNRFTIKTPPRPSSGTPIAPVYIFSVKARVLSTSCGNSAYITKNFQVGSLN